jgi:hypothetical protein
MVAHEEVVKVARERLGPVTSRLSTGEYAMLARVLDPGEPVEAMVIAKPASTWILGSGLIIAATPRRLILAAKSMLTRRERLETIDRARVRGARMETPIGFVLELDDGVREYTFAMPPLEAAGLVASLCGEPPERFSELARLARRKLGRVFGFGLDGEIVVLGRELEPDESVLDLAYATGGSATLIAVCPARVVLVPQQPVRRFGAPEILGYADIRAVVPEGDRLVLRTADGGERELEALVPDGGAAALATRISARLEDGWTGGAGPG